MLNIIIDGGSTPPQQLIGLVLTPVQSFFKGISNSIEDFFSVFTDYDKLEEENEALKKRVNELEDSVNAAAVYEAENIRLRDLLGLKETHPEHTYVYADIVSISTSGFVSRFQINKGSSDGVSAGDIVITSDGLAGYVSSVNLYCSDIITILDTTMSVGAKITATGDMAMTEGTVSLKADGMLKLVYIPRNSAVTRGDAVYTSGLNGTYPADIRIGTIKSIEIEPNGLSQYAIITPSVDFSELKSVYIITDHNEAISDE